MQFNLCKQGKVFILLCSYVLCCCFGARKTHLLRLHHTSVIDFFAVLWYTLLIYKQEQTLEAQMLPLSARLFM